MIADEQGFDLVEISPKANPPVCKIMDYKKFLFEQKKREKLLKSKTSKVVVKELRFGPNTDDHDYEFKKKHAIKFLSDGAKLKAFVFFRGRSIIYKDKGEILLLRLVEARTMVWRQRITPGLPRKARNGPGRPHYPDQRRRSPGIVRNTTARRKYPFVARQDLVLVIELKHPR